MAALADSDRRLCWSDMMRQSSAAGEALPMLKADLKAAVDALDDFLVANAVAVNTSIPQPARGALSISQKAKLLMLVVERRYVTGA